MNINSLKDSSVNSRWQPKIITLCSTYMNSQKSPENLQKVVCDELIGFYYEAQMFSGSLLLG
jgi:hypothetical protein